MKWNGKAGHLVGLYVKDLAFDSSRQWRLGLPTLSLQSARHQQAFYREYTFPVVSETGSYIDSRLNCPGYARFKGKGFTDPSARLNMAQTWKIAELRLPWVRFIIEVSRVATDMNAILESKDSLARIAGGNVVMRIPIQMQTSTKKKKKDTSMTGPNHRLSATLCHSCDKKNNIRDSNTLDYHVTALHIIRCMIESWYVYHITWWLVAGNLYSFSPALDSRLDLYGGGTAQL